MEFKFQEVVPPRKCGWNLRIDADEESGTEWCPDKIYLKKSAP